MTLKPEVSIGMGLAVGVLVWGIYQHAVPSIVDHRVGDVGDTNAAAAERTATWISAASVAGISIIARDPTVFVLGGSMVVILSFVHRHANMVNAITGRATAPMPVNPAAADANAQPDSAYLGVS